MNFLALLNNRRGNRALNQAGSLDKAAVAFERATRQAADWSVPWYNLGLVRKRQQRWGESLACNLRAAALNPADEAAWWNAGIAATALSEWDTARMAWSQFGIALPQDAGEIRMQLGPTPIRLNPEGNGEVVWCERIDPARAIIRNVPLPESGYRYGDMLLHDGAPNGTRRSGGEDVPVFDALQLLHGSPYATYVVRVQVGGADDVLALADLAVERDLGVEDWETIRHICATCSQGSPGTHAMPTPHDAGERVELAIAARSDDELQAMLEIWRTAQAACAVLDVILLVPGTAASDA
jgi:tetratricopeptide (TPR) repeat protein